MDQLTSLLSIYWPAAIGVPFASFAAQRSGPQAWWATAPFWIVISALLSLLSFSFAVGASALYRDLVAAAFFGALAPWVAALAGGQRSAEGEASRLQRILGCVPGWLVLALAPFGMLLVHCTSGDCL